MVEQSCESCKMLMLLYFSTMAIYLLNYKESDEVTELRYLCLFSPPWSHYKIHKDAFTHTSINSR